MLTRKAVRHILDTNDNTEDQMYANHYKKMAAIAKFLRAMCTIMLAAFVGLALLAITNNN